MYGGHIGVALLAKGVRKEVPLLLLIVASISVDFVAIGMQITGIEVPQGLGPYSIPGTALTAIVITSIVFAVNRNIQHAIFAGLVALSHVLLNWVTSRLIAWPGGPMIGLGLYVHDYPLIDFVIEGVLILVGWLVYRKTVPLESRNLWGTWAMLILLILCQGMYAGMLARP